VRIHQVSKRKLNLRMVGISKHSPFQNEKLQLGTGPPRSPLIIGEISPKSNIKNSKMK